MSANHPHDKKGTACYGKAGMFFTDLSLGRENFERKREESIESIQSCATGTTRKKNE